LPEVYIDLDGLSLKDAFSFFRRLPKSQKYILENQSVELDGETLVSSQALWAEFLTGERWYRNGCCGYSKPGSSLNQLNIVSERALAKPLTCLYPEAMVEPVVAINVPLTSPGVANRLWLSDGSLPTIQTVTPRALSQIAPFNNYRSRPFSTVVKAVTDSRSAADLLVRSELVRLECARALLFEHQWSRFFWRVSLFDQLAHTLGLDVLEADGLIIEEIFDSFCTAFDDLLFQLLNRSEIRLFVFSLFSHVACRGIFNLNAFLAENGYCQFVPAKLEQDFESGRVQALTAVSGSAPTHSELRSLERRLRTDATLAASPIQGCVFINSRSAFSDGAVDALEYSSVRAATAECLQSAISARFGGRIEQNPHETPLAGTPEFMVHIDGIEFHDLVDNKRPYDIPRTTHSPLGFLISPIKLGQAVARPSQLSKLIWG
jgi:hypothetical protein